MGADQVIDYTQEDFTQTGHPYDLIVDMVANHSTWDLKRSLIPTAFVSWSGFTIVHMLGVNLLGRWISMMGTQEMGMLMPKEDESDLVFMKELLEAGKVVPVIDRQYAFSEVAEAIRYLERGHARGKVVITMGQNNKN